MNKEGESLFPEASLPREQARHLSAYGANALKPSSIALS
ncbi:hypothetical protein CCOS2040_22710 [Streptomyces albidoflavus]|nr:hypothetical protein CCOS2040_22710 [Streptomyces albidoflavus]